MNNKYIKTFDLLRVIAVLAVFFYHLVSIYVPSGYFGVAIFFVFAGFLSMKPIVDREEPGNIKEGIEKVKGKIYKLYPNMLFVIILVTIVMLIFFKNFLTTYPVDAISSALSVNNYSQIIKKESYFEAMNSLKPLTHMWALALEFQFYVIFYLIVSTFYKKENKNKFAIVFGVLTVLSFAYSLYLAKTGADLTRIYYGIDTRIGTFLIGMIAAMYADIICEKISSNKKLIRVLKYVLLAFSIIAMFVKITGNFGTIAGLVIYSILTALMILVLYCEHIAGIDIKNKKAEEKNSKEKKFSLLGEIVKRSYLIYLVHYPIIIFANRILAHSTLDVNMYFVIIIVLTIIITEIIYRINYLLFAKNVNKNRNIVLIALMFLFVIISSLLIMNQSEDATKYDDNYIASMSEIEKTDIENEGNIEDLGEIEGIDTFVATDSLVHADGIYNAEGRLLVSAEELNTYKIQSAFKRINSVNAIIGGDAVLSREDFLEYKDMNITIIGDSVTQGSKGSLSIYFPNGIVNAQGNRQLRSVLPEFYEMKEKNQIGDVVVIALGTNSDGDIRTDVLEEIYNNIGDRPMIVLTVAIPYVIEEQKRNKALRGFAESHDRCHIADWYTAIKKHSEYFVGDDTHPKDLGTDVYAQVVFKAAIDALQWRKVGNEWQYFGSGNKAKYIVEIEKNIGDTVKFGSYYINNENEKEPIEWIILDKNEDTKTEILLSKYVLDRRKYNELYVNANWQKSELRTWLNNEFYTEAFEGIGGRFVLVSAIDNHKNPDFKTLESGTTYDKVYLPSYDEMKKYLDPNYLRAKGTQYFEMKGGYVDKDGFADWWGRTPGDTDKHIMNVAASGEIVMKGDYVTTDDIGIRPMIKVIYK